ncbi:hypothetical protein H312_02843, partial [Anncaliia algerae PRA339]
LIPINGRDLPKYEMRLYEVENFYESLIEEGLKYLETTKNYKGAVAVTDISKNLNAKSSYDFFNKKFSESEFKKRALLGRLRALAHYQGNMHLVINDRKLY